MTVSEIWDVDRIIAAALAHDLGDKLSCDDIANVAERMAEHRRATFDLCVSRIQSDIATAVQSLVENKSYRSHDWAEGCRSAEAAILIMTSNALSRMRQTKNRSKGDILRDSLSKAKLEEARNPKFTYL